MIDETDLWAQVSLLPVRGGASARGDAVAWTSDAVTLRVSHGMARALDGQPLWVTATTRAAHVVILQGHATRSRARRDEIVVDDVVHLATETRRSCLRAPVEHPVLLVREGTRSRTTTSLDLSAAGCRLRRLPEQQIRPGEIVRAAVDVDSGPAVWADSEVVRVDEEAGEIALHFRDVADADRERLDREILGYLTSRSD